MLRRSVGLLLVLAFFVAEAAPAPAEEPGGNPFEGEWSLTFDVNTPPGGVTLTNEYGSNSPYHVVFRASKQSLRVAEDGTITFRGYEDDEDDSAAFNGTANYFGTQTEWWAKHRPLLKATGQATAKPNPPGSPQPYDRSLEVNLDWSGGNGAYGDNHGGGGAYIVDTAGEQMTVTGVGGPPTTLPVTYCQSKWSLKPARTTREEISPDEIRETTTYEGSRPAEIATKNSGKYKVTERIEVKQVRQLNLVPRG